ncbi:FlgN protein [Caldanaerovirga acetigignens]|uniref:FlgN protein n=1 Tax=Caldanaerovirga acetigignens TaxID=447595 RepID=A0A1M7IDG6_9FIRM|nr:flagellar protein FlgN [Caldanaerovirga acetigignens]SHM38633.1 FlgN protein [Caldanaerovirga acetigignens]
MKCNGFADELIGNLKKQAKLYGELLLLSEKKTDVLIRGDVKALEEITRVEQEMVLKLGEMEGERVKITETLCGENVTAEKLKDVLPVDKKSELEGIVVKMKDTLLKLQRRNEINEKLIRRALEYINFSIELMTSAVKKPAGYDAGGRTSEDETLNIIDKKA